MARSSQEYETSFSTSTYQRGYLYKYTTTLINDSFTLAFLKTVSARSSVGDTTAEFTVIAEREGVNTETITAGDRDHILVYDPIRTRLGSVIIRAILEDGELVIIVPMTFEFELLIVLILMRIAGRDSDMKGHETWRDK